MYTAETVALALAGGLFAFAKIAVPLGLAGSLLELAGQKFGLPKVERLGHALKSFFSDVPGAVLGPK